MRWKGDAFAWGLGKTFKTTVFTAFFYFGYCGKFKVNTYHVQKGVHTYLTSSERLIWSGNLARLKNPVSTFKMYANPLNL